jgi:CHASE3 domain sensor protein
VNGYENLNTRIDSLRKTLREGERSTVDLQALQKVQEQFDDLIKKMTQAKILLAGLEIGGDDAYYEEYEKETSETGEIK